MTGQGLDEAGFIVREGSLDRVSPVFAPVVAAARAAVGAAFGPDRLHSGYLYGSIPRGTAVAGRSDLDLLLALHREPDAVDRASAEAVQEHLDAVWPQIDGVGILLFGVGTLLGELERHDLGWFLACLCTPLTGPDLADRLPRYRPTPLLARETNGDLPRLLPRWRARAADIATTSDPTGRRDEARRVLCRGAARTIVRTGFTLVMPRWNGWTSDLAESAEAFAPYYPERAEQMRTAAAAARSGSPDPAVLALLLEDLGPWLAAEYTAVHGPKTPRP
ncbi:nucleotidyltransferase domain-containing protein [Kitasatospora nipponensis]|uniref:Nucleotidyltransferase domain-containing protein n=1 Tax=Kitasatospora nipponensis TaxID=258049 RepID=A0ABP4GK43_9ACTN